MLRLGWLFAALLFAQTAGPSKEERLWQHRNLGKAFYENPTTQLQAVEEFRKALELAPGSARERLNYGLALLRAGKTQEGAAELKRVQQQDPRIPHTWFNLGIVQKNAGETEEALKSFRRMVALVPGDAVSQYNLGVLLKMEGKLDEAMAQFRKAAELDPSLAAPHFQLFNAYRVAGDRAGSARELALFQAAKKAQEASGISEDMEWSEYAEVWDPIDPVSGPADLTPRFRTRLLRAKIDPLSARLEALDFDSDGKPDLLVWSSLGAALYRGAAGSPIPLPAATFFAIGDADNDGDPDLCMLSPDGAALLRNNGGKFERQPLAAGSFVEALWVDYDHDYDLDLLLLGPKPVLLRNQGDAGFADRTADFPFAKGTPMDAVAFRVVPDSKATDVLVTYSDRETVLYRDRLAGRYDATPLPAVPRGAKDLAVADWNHDSTFDLAFVSGGSLHRLANTRAGWKPEPAVNQPPGFAFGDFTASGRLELRTGGAALTVADFNNDLKLDYAEASAEGVRIHENVTRGPYRAAGIRLIGVKNRKLAEGAEVEVRSGSLYEKQLYKGVPLVFGLRGASQIDAVRLTWPNGLIQSEAKQPVNKWIEYKEAQRLSGSCPMIYTWDGKEFRFLTDVLGVAPLGASSGDGEYFPTDHDEYVSIPGEVLKARDGFYDLRMTEELAEVTYLDQVKLIAVDHPAEWEIYSNEKWKSPPYPEFRLYGTRRRLYPTRAADHNGRDVLPNLRHRDRVYAGAFARTMQNTAEMHSLELRFAPDAPAAGAFLVLHGWVDWADGSVFLKKSQEPGQALQPPYLQVRDAAGNWRTVIEDMGIPSGKTKTIAVDLSGKFLSASRDIRIVTNMCVFWDEVFLGVEDSQPPVRLHDLPTAEAELAFHGFSTAIIHPERKQPEHFLYQPASATSFWNPTPGMYTRYGDVKELLEAPDDRMAILGSGDEVRLRFLARAPALPAGWKRDFLLLVDGWAKDADANTAYSQSVAPLPFHGMTKYPYGENENYPDTAAHRAYRERFNTRPALRLLRPLVQ